MGFQKHSYFQSFVDAKAMHLNFETETYGQDLIYLGKIATYEN